MRFSPRQIGWLLGFVLGIWLRAITAWIMQLKLSAVSATSQNDSII